VSVLLNSTPHDTYDLKGKIMPEIQFKQVDVFTTLPFKGNPVAVVMDASELTTEQMHLIASWTNLSETTFVLPPVNPQADYQVRIFTPTRELPFAGHPTIGTAYALLEAGLITRKDGYLVQECGVGLVNLQVTQNTHGHAVIAFELPEPEIMACTDAAVDRLEAILGCSIIRACHPALVDVGARWIVVQTTDAAAALKTLPNYQELTEFSKQHQVEGVCVYGLYPDGHDFQIEVRSFAPACGVNEDPVCGSGNGCVAAFIRYHGSLGIGEAVVRSSQGLAIGRQGKLELHITEDRIRVGGSAVTCISGVLTI